MKLKHIIATCAVAVAACGSLQAAKTADQLRIYINPGHGSWTANDRPMKTIDRQPYSDPGNVDTTGFFETNTNIQKGLALLYKLNELGIPFDKTKNQTNSNPARLGAALDLSQNLVMSHVKAGPYPTVKMGGDAALAEAYNRSLSEISAEADENNFDMFISIHSNANVDGDGVNYPLFLYRGSDAEEQVAGSKAMAQACWPFAYGNKHMDWSAYANGTNIRGDWSFYGSHTPNSKGYDGYLGVLKHGVPGFLVEGYFHTYQPARYRAMNDDVCHQEGIAYAHGIAKYFGLGEEKTGYIYGIVRDLHEVFKHDLYKAMAKTPSVYKPINGATVTLMQGDTKVAEYTTDKEYNGAFVFESLTPGEYKLVYSHPDYKPATEEYLAPVTVKANETTYVNAYLESTSYIPPKVVYTDYPDEINNAAIGASSAYNFTETYVDATIAELAGKTIRRSILRGNNLFVLALDADKKPFVYIIDATTKAVVKTLGTEGTSGTELALSDIQLTADGVLVGCSKNLNHYNAGQVKEGETRGEVNVYKWTNNEESGLPEGNPAVWFTTQKTGNFLRAYAGATMMYQGTIDDGTMVISAQTVASSTKVWSIIIPIFEGAKVSDASFQRPEITKATEIGDDYTYTLSPLNKEKIVISGSKALPMEMVYSIDEDEPEHAMLKEGLINVPSSNISFFKYSGHSFMVAGDVENEKNVTKIIDVTDGFDKATLVKVNIENATEAQPIVAATGRTIVTKNDDDLVTAANIELVTLQGNGSITKLTTEKVEQPKFRAEYAYDLSVEGNTIKFKSTGDAPKATINVANEEDNVTFIIDNVVKGENSFTIPADALTANKEYSWSVEIESYAVPTASLVYAGTKVSSSNRGGVAIDKDPESDLFGQVYVSTGGSNGLQVLTPDFTEKGTFLKDAFKGGNASSPLRISVSNGKVYLTDWSDAHAGLWIYDPASGVDNVTNFFDGTKESSGRFVNAEGVAIGGGTTGVAFYGKGEDRKLYTFCEDYPTGNAGQKIVRYDVGTKESWNVAPSAVLTEASAKMLNTNVELNVVEQGVFASQVRGAGNNNTGAPAFVFADNDGKIIVNGGNMKDLNGCSGAGLAINNENNLFAIVDGDGNIRVYDLAWENGVPQFSYKYSISTGATEINQLTFDQAGNLYAYKRSAGLAVYSIPNPAPKAVTPAKSSVKIVISGVETVETTAALNVYPNPATDIVYVNAGVEIENIALYNLAGAQVASYAEINGTNATINVADLVAGTYLLKVNGQTVKVIKK